MAIGIVLGGTQALSRSFFSLLIPRGREGEYFSLYSACERGTSWFGTLLFGVVFQVTGSYRPAIFALIVFFVLGRVLPAPARPGTRHPRGRQPGPGTWSEPGAARHALQGVASWRESFWVLASLSDGRSGPTPILDLVRPVDVRAVRMRGDTRD